MRSVDAVPPPPRSPDTPLLITDDAQSVAVRSSAGTSINRQTWLFIGSLELAWSDNPRGAMDRRCP
jgi:hypothetical protein